MTAQDAKAAAERWIASTDMGGYRARFAEVRRRDGASHEWAVVFEMYGPEGRREERPMTLIVNETTRAVAPIPSEM